MPHRPDAPPPAGPPEGAAAPDPPSTPLPCQGCPGVQTPKRKRAKREYENAEMFAMLGRLINRLTIRVAEGDPEDLAEMVDLDRRLHAAVTTAGRMMLEADPLRSYTDLGRAVGITRQSAWERWGDAPG